MDLPVTVGVDTSEASLLAADWAAREALVRDRPLRALHALPRLPHPAPGPPSDGGGLLHEVRHVLTGRHPAVRLHTEEVQDVATSALGAAAEDAELLVVGARGDGGFAGLRVGSTALYLVARAGCPTVVLPVEPAGPAQRDHLVVGVDARRPAEAALEFAFAAAARSGLVLRAVHATTVAAAERKAGVRDTEAELLARALAPWRAAHPGVEVVEVTERTAPGPVLVEASAKAALLVLGRRPTIRIGLLGPVAHAVLHHAACPVAVVPDA
ncbi:universal stress protein [Kitasatospora sp. NPDC056184]|uniref:universal stress protein n=1 Tax=Kitasatospora sp. NPDC056184 TaxID=3345738 RepID=UPI0035DD314E